jgi:hypothetical protein
VRVRDYAEMCSCKLSLLHGSWALTSRGDSPDPPFTSLTCVSSCALPMADGESPDLMAPAADLVLSAISFGVPLMPASYDADTNIGQWEQSLTGPITGGAFP